MAVIFKALIMASWAQAAGGFTFADPAVFTVRKVAGDDLAHDIYTLALDERGRVYVSGPGYIRILHDKDSDGAFDSATDFFRGPASGCQGMAFRDGSLYTTGGRGLERYDDRDSDGVADGPPELLLPLSGGEHGAHALRFGPDGMLYFLGGNHCDLPRDRVKGFSPIREFHAGVFCRMDPRAERIEVWTDGMRNAYDFDFDELGEAIGWDSDSERNEGLAWYRPCRIYHFTPGANCGWRGMGTGEVPAGGLEAIAPAAEIHRGSPTGVLCYRHTAFPARYHGGIFALDWTFGRVYSFQLSPAGASYTARGETFLQAAADVSFAPTDVVCLNDGSLLISSGGRGIEGSVYRVAPTHPGLEPRAALGADTAQAARSRTPQSPGEVLPLLADASQRVRRVAVESAMRFLGSEGGDALGPSLLAMAREPDPRLRHAVIAALSHMDPSRLPEPSTAAEKVVLGFALVRQTPRGSLSRRGVELALDVMDASSGSQVSSAPDSVLIVEAARLIAACFDRLKAREDPEYFTYDPEWERVDLSPWDQVVERSLAAARKLLELDGPAPREGLRLCARLRDSLPETAARAARRLSSATPAADDMLTLWCLSQLASRWDAGTAQRVAAWALDLDLKLHRQGIGRDEKWSLFQQAIWQRLLERHAEVGEILVNDAAFGRAEHLDCIAAGPQALLTRAALKLVDRPPPEDLAERRKTLEFLALHVPMAAGGKLARLLRESAREPALRHSALEGLAHFPEAEDRRLFVDALREGDPVTLGAGLEGLGRLPPDDDPCAEAVALLVWAARLENNSDRKAEQRLVAERLRVLSRGEPRLAKEWFFDRCPDHRNELELLLGAVSEGDALVASLLGTAPWAAGDPTRGKKVFTSRSCSNCHHVGGIGQRVGPDLAGVSRRLGLKELLVEIVVPSKNVPERYFFTDYVLGSGEVVQGMEIYSARTSISTVTRDGRFRRLDPAEIVEARPQRMSLMPAGLLAGLSPADVADLVAFLSKE